MRALFFILLLMNTAFFAWQFQKSKNDSHDHPVAMSSNTSNAPTLVLLREEKTAGVGAESGRQDRVLTDDNEPVCYEIGPFYKAENVDVIQEELISTGIHIDDRRTKKVEKTGYLVYLSNGFSLLTAREKLNELRERGLVDISVLVAEKKNVFISLGFFSNIAIAKERLSFIKTLGYKAEMKSQGKSYDEYWLDISIHDRSELSEQVLNRLAEEGGHMKYNKITCH